jgi:hypothetical protein
MSTLDGFSHPVELTFSRTGAANLDDMKDMLANLPQYQEQREKVPAHRLSLSFQNLTTLDVVFCTSEHGSRVYGSV